MFSDEKDYTFLVTMLILAIAVSLIFHIFFKQDVDASFSEIYFPYPNELPNMVFLDHKYNFTFSISNHEQKPATYEYNSKLELFNLYDVTEGIYKCAAQQRKKVVLKWVESNEPNTTKQTSNEITGAITSSGNKTTIESNNTISQPYIYSESDDYGFIDWKYYVVEYSFENLMETGRFTAIFYDKTKTKYSFIIDGDTGEAVMMYSEDSNTKSEKKKIQKQKQNIEVTINVTDGIRFYIDDEVIFDKKISNLTGGQLGFRMDNGYFVLNKVLVYRDSPIEVRNSKYIREYDIDNSFIIPKLEEFRRSTEKYYYLISNTTNYNASCVSDECSSLKSFLNNPTTHDFATTIKGINETFIFGLIDAKGTAVSPDYAILQNSTANKLLWPNFTLRLDFQLFVKPHTFLVSFDKEFMIMFHNTHIYFVDKNSGNLTIYRRASPVDIGVNEILLESKNHNTIVYINQIPLFNIKKEMNFEEINIYTKNTFIIFDKITVSNNDRTCRLTDEKECRRVYNIPSQRQVSSRREVKAIADPLKFSAALGAAPFLGVNELFEMSNKTKELLANDSTGPPLPDISQILDYEIDINPLIINKNIPSEKYVFNGANAKLINQTNYTFSFNFYILEGAGLMEVSFYNNKEKKAVVFLVNQPKNEAYLFTYHEGSLVKDIISINTSRQNRHGFQLEFESNKTAYNIDGRNIIEPEGTDMSNGFFSISTYNTYIDLVDINFYDRTTKRAIPFSINKDPCSLRKIDEIPIKKESLYLDNNERKNITQSFSISKDFDYGMASVSLKQENRNESEIHFWVVRND